MTILETILLFMLITILVLVLINKEGIEQVLKEREISYISYNQGYYTINWDKLSKNSNLQSVIQDLSTDAHREEFEEEFKQEWFRQIYFRNTYSILTIASQLHNDKSTVSIDKDKIKRVITVSGILFGFKIPEKLFLIDELTLIIAIKYCIVTKRIKINTKAMNYTPMTEKEIECFQKLLIHIPLIMVLVSKNVGLNRVPNITVMCDSFMKAYPHTWEVINKDIKNFKRLLTVCYGICGLHIPRDYVEIDECVYKYLIGEVIEFTKIKRHHLKLV